MSNMKDYAMWLDDKGIAVWDDSIGELIIPEGVNVYADEFVQEYSQDANWHHIDPDDDDYLIEDDDEEMDVMFDDDDPDEIAWTPEDYWFHPDGGLTGEAYVHLYAIDSKGEFV